MLCEFLISRVRATCLAVLILLDLMSLIIFVGHCTLLSSSSVMIPQPPATTVMRSFESSHHYMLFFFLFCYLPLGIVSLLAGLSAVSLKPVLMPVASVSSFK